MICYSRVVPYSVCSCVHVCGTDGQLFTVFIGPYSLSIIWRSAILRRPDNNSLWFDPKEINDAVCTALWGVTLHKFHFSPPAPINNTVLRFIRADVMVCVSTKALHHHDQGNLSRRIGFGRMREVCGQVKSHQRWKLIYDRYVNMHTSYFFSGESVLVRLDGIDASYAMTTRG